MPEDPTKPTEKDFESVNIKFSDNFKKLALEGGYPFKPGLYYFQAYKDEDKWLLSWGQNRYLNRSMFDEKILAVGPGFIAGLDEEEETFRLYSEEYLLGSFLAEYLIRQINGEGLLPSMDWEYDPI